MLGPRGKEFTPVGRGRWSSDQERFMSKVNKTNDCWLFTGSGDGLETDYGRFFYKGRMHAAHRIAYILFVGPIPEGQEIDHTCEVHRCVRPDHLEPCTHKENNGRTAKRRPGYNRPKGSQKARVCSM